MPITLEFDAGANRLRTTATGEITLAHLLAHINDEDRADRLGATEIFDARDATTNLMPTDVRQLIGVMRGHANQGTLGPTALVTRSDVVFGMARMYGILSSDFDARFQAFRSLIDAEGWLNAGAPPI